MNFSKFMSCGAVSTIQFYNISIIPKSTFVPLGSQSLLPSLTPEKPLICFYIALNFLVILYKWNQIICSYYLSSVIKHDVLRFTHGLVYINSSFLLHMNILYGWSTFCLSNIWVLSILGHCEWCCIKVYVEKYVFISVELCSRLNDGPSNICSLKICECDLIRKKGLSRNY